MTLWLCFMLFVAPVVLSGKIDAEVQNVFGTPDSYAPAALTAKPVTPAGNGTLVDPDYWDSYDDFQPATSEYDEFDLTITKRIATFSSENFLLSPLGLKLALALLAEAATGITQTELTTVLAVSQDRTAVRKKFSQIIASMQAECQQYDLNLGSRIYIASHVEPRQRFSAISEQFYKTQLQKLDFGNPAAAAGEINSWVSNTTRGRISNLISEDDVRGSIVFVLTTLFFKGSWRHQFNPNDTNPGNFYVTPTDKRQVPFMHVKNKFYYVESAKYDAKIIRLSYLGSKFSMYLVVPNSLTGLNRVWSSLSDLRTEMLYLQEKTVDVYLPKFKFDYTSLLDGVLKDLGIRSAFEDTASFPGLARGQLLSDRLKISKVLQRSGIELNEVGTVAYAATEIKLENKFGEGDEFAVELIANKPFMFFIEDETTRQFLFTGRVSNPLSATATFKLN